MYIWRYDWPKYLHEFGGVIKGISYKECIVPSCDFDEVEVAHAHCSDNSFNGWICLRNKYFIKNKKLMLHEIAHLFAGQKNGHNDVWRKQVLRIGGTLDPFSITDTFITLDLHKKPRKKNGSTSDR